MLPRGEVPAPGSGTFKGPLFVPVKVHWVTTTAEGAKFNGQLADLPGSPTHNVFMIEWLLDISKQALEDEYGVSAPSTRTEE